MTRSARAFPIIVALAGFSPMAVLGHEEPVIFGKVEAFDQRTIVVSEGRNAALRTISVMPDTEILVCKRAKDFKSIAPGTPVRVKYSDTGRLGAMARAVFLLRNDSTAHQPR